MKQLVSLIVAVIGVFTLIGTINFVLDSMQQVSRMTQGDPNAAKEFGDAVKDEIVSEAKWAVTKTLIIAVAGALGLTGFVAIFKRL